jgi:hypothetical protein
MLTRQRAFLAVVMAGTLLGAACTERVILISAQAEPDADPAWEPEDASGGPDLTAEPDAGVPRDSAAEPKCSGFTQNLRLEYQSPEVVVALDRSFSMFAHKPGEKNWWQWVKQELVSYINSNEGAIQFGYEEFPGRALCDQASGCCGSRVLVSPALNTHWEIEHQLKCDNPANGCFDTSPDSPSGDALARIRAFYESDGDPSADRYVLLITDGNPSCANDPTECDEAARQAGKLFSGSGIKTIVLGLGDEATKSTCLDAVASRGQTRLAGPVGFVSLTDPTQLGHQLAKALAPVEDRTCRFVVRGDDKERETMTVTVNYTPLPRDPGHLEGWDFESPGAPVIRLYGSTCKKLKCALMEPRAVKAQVECTQCGSTVTCP